MRPAGARPEHGPGIAYRPALDGVRALAVAAVLLFHGGVAVLPGGFLGVDAFFVLSGFLITSLLLAEHEQTGRIRLAAFWGRRARRLLPALLVVLVVVAVVGRYLLPDVELGLLRGDALAALGYVANWRMIYRGSDYFTQTAAPSPLQHTWSLGIEEQFYWLWPLIVVGLLALGVTRGRRVLGAVCVAGALGSALAAFALYRPDDVNRAYFGTDTRAQALLIGCALATVPLTRGRRGYGALAVAGTAGTAWLWTHADGTDAWLYRGGFTVTALAVAAVLAHAVASPRGPTAWVLALPPLVWLGRISYGLYLWHWPLFQFVTADRTGLRGVALLAVRCGLTVAVATVSFYLIEQPIRRGRWLRRVPRFAPVGATVLAMSTVAALVGVATLPEPTPTVVAAPVVIAPPSRSPSPAAASPAPGHTPPVRRAGRAPGADPRVTFFGDSVSWTLGTYLPPHPGLATTNRAVQGCGIATLPDILITGTPHTNYDYCPAWPTIWRKGMVDDPDVAVVLLDRWELMDRKLNGAYQHVGQPDFNAYLMGMLDQAVQIVDARGARVVLLTAPYTNRSERPDGGLYPEDDPARVDAWNTLVRAEAAKHPDNTSVLDLNKVICPGGAFTWTINGMRVRSDGLHFTPAAVQKIIAPWLLPQLAQLATS
jgi:peptidoglycan/LPS O-acetylase OafA/YrhL